MRRKAERTTASEPNSFTCSPVSNTIPKQERGINVNIREFQGMMYRLYFQKDSNRGATGTYNWLVDEVRELGEALKVNDKKNMKEEFADVMAWLASLANVTDIDLEAAALKKYNHRCPRCGHSPCKCTPR